MIDIRFMTYILNKVISTFNILKINFINNNNLNRHIYFLSKFYYIHLNKINNNLYYVNNFNKDLNTFNILDLFHFKNMFLYTNIYHQLKFYFQFHYKLYIYLMINSFNREINIFSKFHYYLQNKYLNRYINHLIIFY